MAVPMRDKLPAALRASARATAAFFVAPLLSCAAAAAESREPALAEFHQTISPILSAHCYECHGDGAKKAGVAFDELTTKDQILRNPQFWYKVLRNTRSHMMPPPGETPPTPGEQLALERWIKTAAFALDPAQPDPGRVTVRRLNRTEYRNTVRDLLGVDFDVDVALPPDDIGYGFDNIGDVLSLSPTRMEKFIEAALGVVEKGVPQDTVVIPTQTQLPTDFVTADGTQNAEHLSFYQVRKVTHRYTAKTAGEYRVIISSKVDGDSTPDPQRVRVTGLSDDKEFYSEDFHWSDAEYFTHERTVHWEAGEHDMSFVTQPLLPELKPLRTKMEFKILYLTVEGPLDRKGWEQPKNFRYLYPRDVPPTDLAERRAYAHEILGRFVARAFRSPVSPETVDRLVDLAEKTYSLPGNPFEKGIAQAVVAVLSSPRFLFHLENAEPLAPGQTYPKVDEYTLASRLSYALWASTPDDELLQLASKKELRKNFRAQVQRLLADPKAKAFGENFSGQWLQSRGVLDTPINSADVMSHEAGRPPAAPVEVLAAAPPAVLPNAGEQIAAVAGGQPAVVVPEAGAVAAANPPRPARGFARNRGPVVVPGTVLTPEIRLAMKQETEAYFNHIVRGDRSVLELIDSNYTFVNEPLAAVYGLPNISGPELRLVTLPPENLRGGVLTMGSVLTVTSNPTRTSPVKRGKWILENILGAPPAPPPPNIPSLEDAQTAKSDKIPTQRELLAIHRADAMCASCHSRMDPLGLALESFNAFGRGRTQDGGQPVEPSGELATGEKFENVRGLKQVLLKNHRAEFYRTLTEKLMTYALGRGVEYYDVPTVDRIVDDLEKNNGRFSSLLFGVLESAPFQQRRPVSHPASTETKTVSLTLQN